MTYLNCRAENQSIPSSEVHAEVFWQLKSSFDEGSLRLFFYDYPIQDYQKDDRLDHPSFLIVHERIGILLVDCFGGNIEEIEKIEGIYWYIDGSAEPEMPIIRANEKLINIEYLIKRENRVNDLGFESLPLAEYFVALPNIPRSEWVKRFDDRNDIIFSDSFSTSQGNFPDMKSRRDGLEEETLDTICSILTGGSILRSGQLNVERKRKEEAMSDGSPDEQFVEDIGEKTGIKQYRLEKIRNALKELDGLQQRIGYQIPEGPQQIRGITGSGKTVVCSMRAAKMHYEHPDWTIGLTFRNRSLHQRVRGLVERFYAKFTNGAKPNWNNLHLVHGWGAENAPDGMYFNVASATEGIEPKGVRDAMEEFEPGLSPGEQLERCCQELVEDCDIPQIYDAIIIDEAQDFQHAFYRMCYKALVEPKRLTWAYDEAQNLATLSAPSAVDIFGRNPDGNLTVDVSTKYEGGANATHVMRESYRTPRRILMTAHALGMGLYRDGGIIQTLTNERNWEDIGYEVVEGDFRPESIGGPVKITRPSKHSPHPLTDSDVADDLITCRRFDDRRDEFEKIANQIRQDIEEGLTPDDILVIGLWPLAYQDEYSERLADRIDQAVDVPSLDDDEESACHFALKGSTDEFRSDGKITISNLRLARGNEAGMVYVAGLEQIARERWEEYNASHGTWHDEYVMVRNEAFVALTRSKAWCRVTGTGDPAGIFEEMDEILEATAPPDPVLEFETPDPEEFHKELSIAETLPPESDELG